ncbi:hypothetical protein SUDANB120_03544 [Streptomyces sp. enrichment culture]|uniref:BACON domain-containing protein n=1 Tax=Streptomyces TaxID=1883 RepID=UPI001671987C|nr:MULTISPECIES: sigma-70 family RNA polymerase sigma factor [Streptomyces]MBD3575197.1 hypothetical protein [Streptomyces sp. KD18]GGT15985.1 hypothetical protein GCM10010286_46940 [Streptomyces toxytricini]
MSSINQESPARRSGAQRAHGRTPPEGREGEQAPPFRHEPYLDGLFTYCLSVLCDHDTATDVLADVLAVAERHPGRCPDESDRRAWLYALARWACLRRLAERQGSRHGAHSARRTPEHAGAHRAPDDRPRDTAAAHRRTELARLAWPEAAGTTPEQREALELAVRHRLGVPELAAVLGTPEAGARELLAGAACEVERTRAALAVVETGGCPSVSRLTGGGQLLLSTTLRAELVRHVDDCPRCRRLAERVDAASPWPGSCGVEAALPLVQAPRTAVHAALQRPGRGRGRPAPRFDRTGFPVDPRDRAARRDRLRARAVTTTVVATVVAAPVLALWAAHRGGPGTGAPAGADATRISASEAELPPGRAGGGPMRAYENAGASGRTTGAPGFAVPSPAVSVEVISTGAPAAPDRPGAPGRLTVSASADGATTVLTLTASGGAPVHWRLSSDGPWLRASRTAGTLAPGDSARILITVDGASEPVGPWTARVGVDPGGAVVAVRGSGRPAPAGSEPPAPEPTPTPTPTPTPEPTPTPTPEPTPSGTPEPTPTATPEDPGGTVPPPPADPAP